MVREKHPAVLPRDTKRQQEALDSLSPQRVTEPGDAGEVLERHQREAELVYRADRPGLEKVAPYLLRRLSDERVLDLAWCQLLRMEVRAPGPDGMNYGHPDDAEKSEICRNLGQQILKGTYRPGPERVIEIALGPGQASRPFLFQNVVDRVVEHAAFLILAPHLYPRLADPVSGHSPVEDPLCVLALAEWFFCKKRRQVWAMATIDDPYTKVPLPAVVRLVREYLLADDVARLVGRVVSGSSLPGLRPAGVLSMLLLDLYIYDRVDRLWRKRHPGCPLIRVRGEFLAPCGEPQEARQASASLADLLAAAGMPVSGDEVVTVRPASPDGEATWLGFRIGCMDGVMRYRVADCAFERLAFQLGLAHEDLAPVFRAERFIEDWVSGLGPACMWENDDTCEVYRRVQALAAGLGFDKQIVGKLRFRNVWKKAMVPWNGLRWLLGLAAHR